MPTRRDFLGLLTAAVNVRDHGATGDGSRTQTKAIQNAIDACVRAGGGTVLFPPGRYLSGTLFLKSHVTLYLDSGATLLGSKDLNDYPVTVQKPRSYTDNYTDKSLIYAEDCENIGIAGRGTIDGQGAAFQGPYKVRPYMIRVINCRDVSVTDVSIKDSPMWVQHYLGCEGVAIRGITVRSRVNHNNDGIDIDACSRVRISDCDIWSGDDAIVLKSTMARTCRDVVVSNCVLSSACNALKLGTESNGGFENIAISNCTVYDTRLAGVALEMVDGGVLDGVTVSGMVMDNVRAPIFVRLGDRGRPFQEGARRPATGKLRNVLLTGITARGAYRTGCSISGLPGHAVENVALDNIRLEFSGGGTAQDAARAIAEEPEKYPEYSMFGTLPAFGLYCRHVAGLDLRNVTLRTAAPDARPAVICDDVADLVTANVRGSLKKL